MNAKILVFVICVEAIIYLLLYNLHDCTFKTFQLYWLLLCVQSIYIQAFWDFPFEPIFMVTGVNFFKIVQIYCFMIDLVLPLVPAYGKIKECIF